jgi:hypothetical protein
VDLMGYEIEEQEINVNKERLNDYFTVYTNDSTWLTKLLKFAEPIDPEYENGRIISALFKLDLNQVTLKKKPKKRELTEEQKLIRAERMKELHRKGKL